MWVKLTSDVTGWTQAATLTDTYYRLDGLAYLEVRGPAPTGGKYYIGNEAAGAYLDPGYATQADAMAALDEFVKTEDAGGLTAP